MSLLWMCCNLGREDVHALRQGKISLRRSKFIRLVTSLAWSKSILHFSAVQKRIQVALGQREIHSVEGKAGIPNTEVSIAFMHCSKTQPVIKHSWCQTNK